MNRLLVVLTLALVGCEEKSTQGLLQPAPVGRSRGELRPPTDTVADLALGQAALNLNTINLADERGVFGPEQLAIDGSGRLYLADTSNHRVLGWPSAAAFSNGAPAALVLGQPDFNRTACNQGGVVSATTLCSPRALAVDSSGNLFVADTSNSRVLEYDSPFTTNTTADRVFGQAGFAASSCLAIPTASTLCSPAGVGVDSTNALWIADTNNHRVLRFATPLTSQVAANVLGQANFTDKAPNRVTARGLSAPRYVAIDRSVTPNRLYVSDSNHHRILGWASAPGFASGDPASVVIGQADFSGQACNTGGAASASSLCNPGGIAVDAAGNLLVADVTNSRVLGYLSPFTSDKAADKVWGQAGFTTTSCAVGAAALCRPENVFFSAAGDLWVADTSNHRVLKFLGGYAGDTTADAVFGQALFTTNTSGLSATALSGPKAVVLDASGNVFVSDTNNSRVLAFLTAPTLDGTADRVFGQLDYVTAATYTSDTATGLYRPSGLAFDSAGTLWVADNYYHGKLKGYQGPTADQTPDLVLGQTTVTSSHCDPPLSASCWSSHPYEVTGVAFDSGGNLYLSLPFDNRVLSVPPPITANKPATRVLGQTSFAGNLPNLPDRAGLNFPGAIAFDKSVTPNRLYVTDGSNNRVLGWATNAITNGQGADRWLGQATEFTVACGTTVGVSASTLCAPSGVAVGPTGNVYVASPSENRVLQYNSPFTTDSVADRVFGQTTFTGASCNQGSTASALSLCLPRGVAVDAAENVYVSDTSNHRALRYNTPLTLDRSADAVLGQLVFTRTAANLVDARGLSTPRGVAIDSSVTPNRIYVADTANNRVLGWPDVTSFVNGAPATLVVGQPDFADVACNLTQGSLCFPEAVAVDGAGRLYVADTSNNRVQIFDAPFTTDTLADAVVGQTSYTSNGCATSQTQFCGPNTLAVDSAGNLWVGQRSYNRVLYFAAPRTGDKTADRVYGQAGSYVSSLANNGGVSASGLYYPSGLALDTSVAPARLYISDSQNYRVLGFDNAVGGDAVADLVIGQTGFTVASYAVSQTGVAYAGSVAVDGLGNVYVGGTYPTSTSGYGRVLQFNAPATTDLVADVVYGTASFTSNGCNTGGLGASTLCAPRQMSFDSSGNLYIADVGNHRITVYFANNRPSANPVVLTPAAPNTTNALSCGYTYADPDGDPQSGTTFSWAKGGVVQAGFTASTLPASATTKGQAWDCRVRPRDGIDFGPVAISAPVTVVNSAPAAAGPVVTPALARTNDTLTASYAFTDADGDTEGASAIRWYRGSTLLSVYNDSKTLPGSQFARGDAITFTVAPSDGTISGPTQNSPPLVIANSPPVASLAVLAPASPSASSNLTAGWSYADADADLQAGTEVLWYRNNIVQPALNNLTTVNGPLTAGDSWHFQVRARDGTEYSAAVLSNTVVVGSTAPTASNLAITPSPAYKPSTLTRGYTYADPDGQAQGASETRWFRNGLEQAGLFNSATVASSLLTRGQQWHFTVRPCDVSPACGAVQTSPAITISNSIPTATAFTITPAAPGTNSPLVASFTIADADGDLEAGSEVRWFRGNVEQPTLYNLRTVPIASTTRGDNWYFTLRPSDGSAFGPQVQAAAVLIVNTPPVASAATVAPASPRATDTLSASWSYSDADSDPQVGTTVQWLRNGVVDPSLNNSLTVPPGSLVKGSTWQFRVAPSDGANAGAQVTSNLVTVLNSPPVASGLAITPNPATAGAALTASFTYGDADNDPASGSELRWFKNGVEQATLFNLPTVPAGVTVKGDKWTFSVRPRDGVEFGAPVTSDELTIANRLPVAAGLAITPASPQTDDVLTAQYFFDDADADPESGSERRWFKNNVEQPAFANSLTVPATATTRGESWYVTVRPKDGTEFGALVTSAPVTVVNTPPVASNATVNPLSPKTTDALTASFTYLDADSDPAQGSELRWYKNNVEQTAHFNLTSLPPGVAVANETWHFTIRPNDGVAFGALVTSTSVIVGSSLPVASALSITPNAPRGTDTLTANYAYSDPDGQAESGSQLQWFRNGTLVTGLLPNSKTVPAGTARRSEVWRFTVRPSDGTGFGATQTSPNATVGNSAPVATAAIINPASPDTTQPLSASYTFSDSDLDLEASSEIRWFKNGLEQTALLNQAIVPATLTRKSEVWFYRVRPGDGTDLGVAELSAPVFISNLPPVASAGPDQTLTATGSTTRITLDGSATTDTDGDVLAYAWKEGTTTLASGPMPAVDLAAGVHTITLEVSDGDVPVTDTVVITIDDVVPTFNIAGLTEVGPGRVKLTLEVTDPLARAFTFAWTQLSGPAAELGGLTTATLEAFAVEAAARVYEVTPQAGPTTYPARQVTVTTRDLPPWALAIPSRQVVSVGAEASLDGTKSADPNGKPLTLDWQLDPGGPQTLVLSDPTGASPTARPDGDGRYALRLIVNDGTLDSAPAQLELLAIDLTKPHPPVANAGPDGVAEVNKLLRLDGRGSYDIDGEALTYLWRRISGPAGETTEGESSQPGFRPTSAGPLVLGLKVSDGNTTSEEDTVSFDVIDPATNQRPVARTGADLTVKVKAVASLDGTRSSDPDGDPLTYAWSIAEGGVATLDDPGAAKPNLTALAPGFVRLQLVVSDGKVPSAPATQLVQVTTAANLPPIANAGPDVRAIIGSQVTLDGSGSADPDSNPLRFIWEQLAGSPVLLAGTPKAPAFNPPGAGRYLFRLTVWDAEAPSAPDEVEVVVGSHAGNNQAPIAVVGDNVEVPVGQPVQLDGSKSSDPDPLDRLTWDWVFVGFPTGNEPELDNRRLNKPSFTPAVPGAYTLKLVVSDGELFSARVYLTVYAGVRATPAGCGCGSSGGGWLWSLAGLFALWLATRPRPALAGRRARVGWRGLALGLALVSLTAEPAPKKAKRPVKTKPAKAKVAPAAEADPTPPVESDAPLATPPLTATPAPAAEAKGPANTYLEEALAMYANFELEGLVAKLELALSVKGVTEDQKLEIFRLMAFTHASFDDAPKAEEAFGRLLDLRPKFELNRASPKIRLYFSNAQKRFRERQAVKLVHTPPLATAAGVSTTVDARATGGADRVATMTLHFRPEGLSAGYSQTEMVAGDEGAFSAVVPNVFPGPAGRRKIEYFIRARDKSGGLLSSIGAEDAPLLVEVEVVEAKGPPIYKSGAFWTVIGVVVAGGVASAIAVPLALKQDARPPPGSLGSERLQ